MKKFIFIFILFTALMYGCSDSSKEVSNNIDLTELNGINILSDGTAEVKFKDMVDVDELSKLDGKKVKMVGFFAQSSPLDGSMVYLMNMPYQSCVYCLPNTNQLMNTMAVFPKKGKTIDYTELAVEVTGTIKFEDYTDETGYSYPYRLVDTEIALADVDTLSEDVQIYTQLVNKGFTDKIGNVIYMINDMNKMLYDGESLENQELIPNQLLDEIDDLFNDLDKSKYEDVLTYVSDLKVLVKEVNAALEVKDYDKLSELSGQEVDIFYNVYDWLMKPQL